MPDYLGPVRAKYLRNPMFHLLIIHNLKITPDRAVCAQLMAASAYRPSSPILILEEKMLRDEDHSENPKEWRKLSLQNRGPIRLKRVFFTDWSFE